MKWGRKKYERKLKPRILEHKDLLIQHLQKEWEVMEQATRREDMVRAVKAGGAALGKELLVAALLAGVLTIAVVAPNIVGAIGKLVGRRTYFHKKRFREELAYLKKRKYVLVEETGRADDKKYKIELTKSGEGHAIQKAFGEMGILPLPKWDRKWRLVIFDIPKKHSWARDGFRQRLKALGFYQLQKSIFALPHPCEEEVGFLARLYSVKSCVRFIETETIHHDDDLKKFFALES